MISAYKEGKDLYATIATGIYKGTTYWDNMEHHEDGSPNPEGKKRRSNCKKLLLGIMYGMGPASIAVSINGTTEEAQQIIDGFYNSFPTVKDWMDASKENAKKYGYVEDTWGRRRRLPDIQLKPYQVEFKDKTKNDGDFNPLLGSLGLVKNDTSKLLDEYYNKAIKTKSRKEVDELASKAEKDGIILHSNSNKIAQAERQCINARIQGSAATMSKKAMIKVHNDKTLNDLDFHMLIAVHDELIGECPAEYADQVAERLTDVMKHAAEPDVIVPFKCDPTIEKSWYYSDYSDVLNEEYQKRIDKGENQKDVLTDIFSSHSECTPEQLCEMLNINADLLDKIMNS